MTEYIVEFTLSNNDDGWTELIDSDFDYTQSSPPFSTFQKAVEAMKERNNHEKRADYRILPINQEDEELGMVEEVRQILQDNMSEQDFNDIIEEVEEHPEKDVVIGYEAEENPWLCPEDTEALREAGYQITSMDYKMSGVTGLVLEKTGGGEH